jgi:hypothetical protein
MPEETGAGWLLDQVIASACRLSNQPPSLLSPTARILKADIKAWFEVASFAQQSPCGDAPALHVVHRTSKTSEVNSIDVQQLPLIASLSERPTRK